MSPSRNFGKRPPRLQQVFQTENRPVYFVTFCTYQRLPWLANQEVHQAFITFAEKANREYGIAVGRYVVMPDHLHLFVCGGPDFVLGKWVRILKTVLGKTSNHDSVSRSDGSQTPGYSIPARSRGYRIWQEGFFDHLLRTNESMSQKWNYILENPVRAGLVKEAESWPYAGEITVIDRA